MWGGHTHGECRARAYNWDLEAEPPAGFWGQGQSSLKLKTFQVLMSNGSGKFASLIVIHILSIGESSSQRDRLPPMSRKNSPDLYYQCRKQLWQKWVDDTDSKVSFLHCKAYICCTKKTEITETVHVASL